MRSEFIFVVHCLDICLMIYRSVLLSSRGVIFLQDTNGLAETREYCGSTIYA